MVVLRVRGPSYCKTSSVPLMMTALVPSESPVPARVPNPEAPPVVAIPAKNALGIMKVPFTARSESPLAERLIDPLLVTDPVLVVRTPLERLLMVMTVPAVTPPTGADQSICPSPVSNAVPVQPASVKRIDSVSAISTRATKAKSLFPSALNPTNAMSPVLRFEAGASVVNVQLGSAIPAKLLSAESRIAPLSIVTE